MDLTGPIAALAAILLTKNASAQSSGKSKNITSSGTPAPPHPATLPNIINPNNLGIPNPSIPIAQTNAVLNPPALPSIPLPNVSLPNLPSIPTPNLSAIASDLSPLVPNIPLPNLSIPGGPSAGSIGDLLPPPSIIAGFTPLATEILNNQNPGPGVAAAQGATVGFLLGGPVGALAGQQLAPVVEQNVIPFVDSGLAPVASAIANGINAITGGGLTSPSVNPSSVSGSPASIAAENGQLQQQESLANPVNFSEANVGNVSAAQVAAIQSIPSEAANPLNVKIVHAV